MGQSHSKNYGPTVSVWEKSAIFSFPSGILLWSAAAAAAGVCFCTGTSLAVSRLFCPPLWTVIQQNVFLSLLLFACLVLCNWFFIKSGRCWCKSVKCERTTLQGAISISWLTIWLLLGRLCNFAQLKPQTINNVFLLGSETIRTFGTVWRQIFPVPADLILLFVLTV